MCESKGSGKYKILIVAPNANNTENGYTFVQDDPVYERLTEIWSNER